MKCCKTEMSDFSYYNNHRLIPHFYCIKCGKHIHKNITYTATEWFFLINEASYQEFEAQALMENSPHAHEIINHSNPENV